MKTSASERKKPSPWLEASGYAVAVLLASGALLGWLRILPGLAAFYLFALGGLLAILVTVLSAIQALRGHGFGNGRALGLLAMLVFLVSAGSSRGGPMTNDFTTDLEQPPGFVHAEQLAANEGRSLNYDPSFAAEQRRCCADLDSLRLPLAPGAAFAQARAAAGAMPGWRVTWTDEPGGRIEAVAETPIFGFRDDVSIRVRADGSGSQIDVRSKSRDGRGDLGANAARIRAYLTKLARAPV